MLEVHGLEPTITMSALLSGIRARDFFHFLSMRFPHELSVHLSFSKKYINTKKSMAKKRKERGEHRHPQESRPIPPQPKRQSNEVRSRHHPRCPRHCHDEFTSLNTSQGQILMESKNQDIID